MINFTINRTRLIPDMAIYVGVFVIFLVTGLWGGLSIGSSSFARSKETPLAVDSGKSPVTTTLPTTGQRNLLVVGVDNLTAAHPRLEGAWLVMYFKGKPDLTFLPLHPQPNENSKPTSSGIYASFSLDETGHPSQDFLEQLSQQIWWNNYIVIDKTALTALIDLLGGMQVGNQHLTGAQVLAKMVSTWEGTNGAYVGQARLLSHLCEQAQAISLSEEQVTAKLKQIETNLATDLDINENLGVWLNKTNNSRSLYCEFPLFSPTVP
jgi:hypothetical protein